jgi:hypothetical protein
VVVSGSYVPREALVITVGAFVRAEGKDSYERQYKRLCYSSSLLVSSHVSIFLHRSSFSYVQLLFVSHTSFYTSH